MKLDRLILAILASLVLIALLCPAVQADDNEAEVELKVNIVAAPSVITTAAAPVSTKLAILRGTLTDLGTASTVVVYFEWGETTNYGSRTRPRTMTSPRAFWAIITRLTPGTDYHFRAVAVGDDTSYGSDVSFKTRKRWWWWKWW